ncbi:serine hydrolase domain-containing protein [Gimesia panareensis]|uniref:serine hydrolase domain-containing protein n=1 Tax=Gimesia panareensis TaxID=2527978 RepID=UPI00118CB2A1|nr:serine hydrolase domain-containing protein [Gimesia panareensis]QDU51250.1 D-alanyl-D-alanine carboxypeptidase precursor [Gimesia panareensis]
MISQTARRHIFSRFFLLTALFTSLMAATPSAFAESQDQQAWSKNLSSVRKLVQETMQQGKLKSVLLGISVEGKEVLMLAEGESMTGVPATIDMHLRNGNIAVAYLGNLFYQLVDAGAVKADDPVGKWLPDLPEANSVTLEMLLNGTSGYPDFMPMPAFEKRLYADPFHQWKPEELIQLAFTEKSKFKPGSDWNYAHTNFVILGLALEKAAGKPLEKLMQEHVLKPFGMTQTVAPGTAFIPAPVLHSFTDERGPYEDATYWNPAWTLPRGAVQTSTIRDTLLGFRAVGQGKRLKPESFRAMLAPQTAGMKFWTKEKFYAQGVVINKGWLTQAPSFCGLFGAAGYLPEKDLTVAIWCTRSIDSKTEGNPALNTFNQITSILTPEKPID